MAFDFTKLRDPEWQAAQRAEREKEAARIEAEDKQNRVAVDACLSNMESLSETERSFIRSVNYRLNSFGILSEKQLRWLHDLAGRFADQGQAPQRASTKFGR